MKKTLLSLSIFIVLLCRLDADEEVGSENRKELSQLIGRFFLILSDDSIVSGQTFDVPTLWAAAKLGRVNHPNGILPSMGTRSETEMVPSDSGIVLHFYGPYLIDSTQKVWSTWNDPAKRTFEIEIKLPKGKFIGVTGSYGANFSSKKIADLLSISKELPQGH